MAVRRRAGGLLGTSGSFTMTGGGNRAGNDEAYALGESWFPSHDGDSVPEDAEDTGLVHNLGEDDYDIMNVRGGGMKKDKEAEKAKGKTEKAKGKTEKAKGKMKGGPIRVMSGTCSPVSDPTSNWINMYWQRVHPKKAMDFKDSAIKFKASDVKEAACVTDLHGQKTSFSNATFNGHPCLYKSIQPTTDPNATTVAMVPALCVRFNTSSGIAKGAALSEFCAMHTSPLVNCEFETERAYTAKSGKQKGKEKRRALGGSGKPKDDKKKDD